ncbi:MAG TPA: DUF6077 domain-containing protein [Humibacillus xanthopallidus]|nr:DUF6077 domain-containing protein [Humibacillus xanthopallidus]
MLGAVAVSADTRASDDGGPATWVRAVDGLVECGVYAFAAWTVFYELALVTQWSLWWPARVWIVLTLGLVGWRAFSHRTRERQVQPREALDEVVPQDDGSGARWSPAVLFLAVAAVLVVLTVLRDTLGVFPLVVTGLVVLLAACVQIYHRVRRSGLHPTSGRVSQAEHVVAASVSVGLAVLASALTGSSGDDVYYVNRATWVAERGTPTLNDTVFSAGVLPTTYGSSLPLASIEAWQGAMAHVLGLAAPTFVFLWTVPLLAAASGWASWRLVRSWAPRRAWLVFLVATSFTLFSAGSVVGRYHIGAIWEGKVPAVTVVIPLAWCYLTALTTRPRRAHLLMLAALGVCFVGLTSSAALMAPVLGAAGLLAAWLLRSRACAVGVGCFLLGPVAAGVASVLGPGVGGVDPTALPPSQVFGYLFGLVTSVVALGVVGTVLGPRLVQGPAAALATCAALSGLASLVPGVYDAVNTATGAGPVAWRMVLVIPVAVLVGMLVTARLPSSTVSARWRPLADRGAALAACAVVAVVLAQSTPLWSSDTGTRLAFNQWKVDEAALQDVRAVLPLTTPPGVWLLPPSQMAVLAMTTTERAGVVPRALYLANLKAPDVAISDRYILYRLVTGHYVAPATIRLALDRLSVTLACVAATDSQAGRLLTEAVRSPLEPYGRMRCHVG